MNDYNPSRIHRYHQPRTPTPTAHGTMIRTARLAAGIGLRALGRELDISATYLSRIETGDEPHPPTAEVLDRIATRLGIDRDALYCAAKKVPPELAASVTSSVPAMRLARAAAQRAEAKARKAAEVVP